MPLSGHLCIDGCQPSTLEPGWITYGWLLADRPVRSLVFASDTSHATAAWIGLPRPDLTTAFPGQRHASKSGFLALLPCDPASATTPPRGRWWCEDETGRWWSLAMSPLPRAPEAFGETNPVQPPPEIIEVARRDDDLEARLRMGVAASRGLTLRLDITNKCNLRCVMCHYQRDDVFRRPAQHVTPEQFEQWFSEVSPIVGEVMLSCADEPLVSRFFPDIIRLIRRLQPGVEIKFCTNATLMTEPIRRLLIEQQVNLIVVSMDGCTREMFESIRTGARFDRVVGHVLALADLRRQSGSRRPEIITNFVMMQRNLHEAPPFVALARRLGASTIDFRHVVASYEGFDLEAEQLKQSPGRYNFYRERLLALGAEHGIKLYLPPSFAEASPWHPGPDEPVADLADLESVLTRFVPDAPVPITGMVCADSGRANWLQLSELFADTFCARPFSEIMIREQQEILPCPWHARPLGQLTETPKLLDAFFGDEFRQLRRHMLLPEGDKHCRNCPLKLKELPSESFA